MLTSTEYRIPLPRYDLRGHPGAARPVWDNLRGNSRPGGWPPRHRATRQVIRDVVWVARHHGPPEPVAHLLVALTWAPGRRVRADPDNLWPLLKACCDALARGRKDLPGLHLVPDDNAEHMTKWTPTILMPPARGHRATTAEPYRIHVGLWLDLWALDARPTPSQAAALVEAAAAPPEPFPPIT